VSAETNMRVGHGYDLHRLAVNKPLILGGVAIPSPVGPDAHSDGDVVLHALCDAVLGAAGLGDIGELFPDNEAVNKGRDSRDFLREAVRRSRELGWRVVNADIVVHLQWPKVSPHKGAIRASLAELLAVPSDAVNLKGKTHERMGPVGEGRAIECTCVVLLAKSAELKEV